MAGEQVVASSHATHPEGLTCVPRRRNWLATNCEPLVGKLRQKSRMACSNIGRDTIGVRATPLFDEGGDAAGLEGALDIVERIAVLAHQLASLGHVAEFLGQLQQRQLALGTLGCGGHLGSPGETGRCGNHQSTEGPGARPFHT